MMKMCSSHWKALRSAIDARGIGHLVSRSGREAIESLAEGAAPRNPNAFDPLAAAFLMITMAAVREGGLRMLTAKGDGSARCPVCEAEANGVPEGDWIEGPADDALSAARERGLAPAVQ